MIDELSSRERDVLAGWTIVEPPAGFAERVVATHARRQIVRRVVVASAAVTLAAAAAVMIVIMSRPPAPNPTAPQVYIPPPPPPPPPAPQPVTVVTPGIVSIPMGENATIHDPAEKARFQIVSDGRCSEPLVVEVDSDARFRTVIRGTVRDTEMLELERGSYVYRVFCGEGGPLTASGRITIKQDAAKRPLPDAVPRSPIGVDGRSYRVSYQSVVPAFVFTTTRTGTTYRLHVTSSGSTQTFDSDRSVVELDTLADIGVYEVAFEVDGVRDARPTTLIIDFDQTAPQLQLVAPPAGATWPDPVDVVGAVMPGWRLTVDGKAIPTGAGKFFSRIPRPTVFVLRAEHPQRGIHYYVRRPR